MATDWAKLRRIMYEPSAVWLSTAGERRWLTDQFVLYDVTGLDKLREYTFHLDGCAWEETVECSCPDELPDGAYKLTVSEGFKPRDSVPEPDIEAYLAMLAGKTWRPAEPSEWSVAEHPGKAMLWLCDERPCLLGESTWTEVKRYHPKAEVEWAPNKGAGVFRFREGWRTWHMDPDDDCAAGDCGCGDPPIFAYAAGIRCPEGQEGVADAMVRAILKVPVELDEDDIHDIEVIEDAA